MSTCLLRWGLHADSFSPSIVGRPVFSPAAFHLFILQVVRKKNNSVSSFLKMVRMILLASLSWQSVREGWVWNTYSGGGGVGSGEKKWNNMRHGLYFQEHVIVWKRKIETQIYLRPRLHIINS